MSEREVVVVDYGASNARSLIAALERAGARPVTSMDPTVVAAAARIMLPGQAAAGPAMEQMRSLGLDEAIRSAIDAGSYLFGICLGMHLLYESTEEDDTTGFGLLPGRVERMRGLPTLPHMGWNDLEPVAPHPLAESLPAVMYFAHSYGAAPGPGTIAVTDPGRPIASMVATGQVAGVQCHPERSGAAGVRLLEAFLDWSGAPDAA